MKPPNVFWRPLLQLRSLSLRMRWEVTRRHPSYQVFWNAQAPGSMIKSDADKDLLVSHWASIKTNALGAIGVSGQTIDPATEFEDLCDDSVKSEWLSGAVHPISMRGLASLLVSSLPKDTLQKVGMAILEAGLDDEAGQEPHRLQSLNKIASYDLSGLDGFTTEPFVYINPNASGRKLMPEIMRLLKDWKQEKQLPEKHDRPESEQSYLDAWDRREGWKNGSYSLSREQKFKEIAKDLQVSLSTVHSRYKRAFKLISGHAYTVNNWKELFGPIKLSSLAQRDADKGVSRRLIKKSRPDVPQSRLGLHEDFGGFADFNSTVEHDDNSVSEDRHELETLISAGKSNAAIFLALGIEQTEEREEALNAYKERIHNGTLD